MTVTVAQIDALLPQTQCGQCGHGGCMPYAKAIVQQAEAINRCPPGGAPTLLALAQLLNQSPSASEIEALHHQAKLPALAYIKAEECIGCTKCIQACPVDAIVGAAKQLHVVLSAECTGCELCIEPCPVDCITLVPISDKHYAPDKARQRFIAKQQRNQKMEKSVINKPLSATTTSDNRKAYIQAAVQRAKNKKLPGKIESSQ
jgi:electron transport complex protein RnfB